jgi:hypothetical protein
MNNLPIPDPSAIVLPGPLWLFETLLLATFIVHIIGVNLVLGGSAVSAWHLFRGKTSPKQDLLAFSLIKMLPVAMAMTITFGVPPLLFLQTMHGQLFYTSAILTAWPWLLILFLLVVAYYGFYVLSMKGKDWRKAAPLVAVVSFVMVFLVGGIFTSNLTLMQSPTRFADVYNRPILGLYLNLPDPTMLPRLLHFTLAALAVTGAYLAIRHRNDYELRRIGLIWFIIPTLLQIAVGLWFLGALPTAVKAALMERTILGLPLFHTAMALVVLMLLGYTAGFFIPGNRVLIPVATMMLFITIVLMAMIRSAVRVAQLAPVYVQDNRVASQWGPFAMFAIVLVLGLAVIWWLAQVYRSSLTGE